MQASGETSNYSIFRDDALCSGEFRAWDIASVVTRSVHKTRCQAEAAVRQYEAEDAKRLGVPTATTIESTFTPGPYRVEQRSEFLFAVLGRNTDAGKDGVSYRGAELTICTTDGRDEAERIAYCLAAVEAFEQVKAAHCAAPVISPEDYAALVRREYPKPEAA